MTLVAFEPHPIPQAVGFRGRERMHELLLEVRREGVQVLDEVLRLLALGVPRHVAVRR